jgi:PD-(D/E)XK nuclease superfamily
MIAKIEPFFKNTELINLCFEQKAQRSNNSGLSFNLFSLISDKYQHENLHSEIIAALLDRKSSHNENDKFLIEFLKLINRIKPLIQLSDFENTIVTRERGGRIDVLIKDETSKKAIIIENKINNAADTQRQLPKYLENTERSGYEVVAIVYLPLDSNKKPEQQTWTKEEIQKIKPKFIHLPTSNGSDKDFLNGWLKPCDSIAKNIDAFCVIKQYITLISNLSIKNMDNIMMDSFYRIVLENYETVMETSKLLPRLPQHLAKRVEEHYKSAPAPFTQTFIWQGTCAVLNAYMIGNDCFTIDIYCTAEGYSFQFFCRTNTSEAGETLKKIVQEIGLEKELTFSENRFRKPFTIPQEKELLEFIDDFCKRLVNRINAVS